MSGFPIGGPKYITQHTGVAVVYLSICAVASLVGTLGNILVLFSLTCYKHISSARKVLIINVAIADLFVTAFANPMGIVGMVLGKKFFEERPVLCDVTATVCLTSCVSALLSIGGISFNNCLHICYDRTISLKINLLLCGLTWCLGLGSSLPPLLGWSDNVYDDKMLECIWDRKMSLSYTIFFSVVIVLTPTVVTAVSFLKIFLHVKASRNRIAPIAQAPEKTEKGRSISTKLARSLFVIFAIFVFCWAPYAILVLVDFGDHAPYEIHLFVLLLAHMHATSTSLSTGPPINIFV